VRYLLDTNVCIGILNGRSEKIRNKIFSIASHEVCIPVIVRYELYFGAAKSIVQVPTLSKLEQFLSSFNSLNFDDSSAKMAGEVRALLEKTGRPIGPYDILIAAMALANGLTLVTHNVKEFSRIPNLLLDDWEI